MSSRPRRIVSVASLAITLRLQVPEFPQRGSASLAQTTTSGVGGAYDVLWAARCLDSEVVNLCPLGTGPNSMMVRHQLRRVGVDSQAVEMVGDTGLTLVIMEEGGYYTSVVTAGIEAELEIDALSHHALGDDDVLYVSAGDLVCAPYREAVLSWLADRPRGVRVVLAASPLVRAVRSQWLRDVLGLVDVFTANATEADQVGHAIGCPVTSPDFLAALAGDDAIAVVRDGAEGALLLQSGADTAVRVPSLNYPVVDTLGVGATHTGVLMASLAQGLDPLHAVRRANAAGAIAVSTAGSHPSLDAATLDRLARTLS